jgi:hypothetical protein
MKTKSMEEITLQAWEKFVQLVLGEVEFTRAQSGANLILDDDTLADLAAREAAAECEDLSFTELMPLMPYIVDHELVYSDGFGECDSLGGCMEETLFDYMRFQMMAGCGLEEA